MVASYKDWNKKGAFNFGQKNLGNLIISFKFLLDYLLDVYWIIGVR